MPSKDASRAASTRWIGAGHSAAPGADDAAREAVGAAIQGRADAKLVVLLAAHGRDLQALSAAASTVAGGVPLAGCSTAGEMGPEGPTDGAVVAFALGGPGFAACTGASAVEGPARLRDAAASAIAKAWNEPSEGPGEVVLMFTDGRGGDGQEAVRGAYSVLGPRVPVAGAGAAAPGSGGGTAQVHDGEALEGSVVAAAIASDAPIGVGVRHGWEPAGEPMLVTRSEGTLVTGFDDLPALDVYLERSAAPADVRGDAAAFERFAAERPLGLPARAGEPTAVYVSGADFERRALRCDTELPLGVLAWILDGEPERLLTAAEAATDEALAALGGRTPCGLLAFSCVARRALLGPEGTAEELRRIRERAPGVPLAGCYTNGEFARLHGPTGFHNQTLVVVAFA